MSTPDRALLFVVVKTTTAEDLVAQQIELTSVLIKQPQATYLLKGSGHSMVEAGSRTCGDRYTREAENSTTAPSTATIH